MSKTANTVELRGICKSFGTQSVLTHVNLSVADGTFLAIAGLNGSGKTTLLRIVATLLSPTSGELELFGRPINSDKRHARSKIGAMLTPALIPQLTVRENLQFYGALTKQKGTSEELSQMLELEGVAKKRVDLLSTGYRKRLALAMTLQREAKLLVLDEPFDGLDEKIVATVIKLLEDFKRAGGTLLFVAHQAEYRRQLADRTQWLKDGCLHEEAI